MRLSNKVCIVTGSSRGIGAAIARAFAREGAIVTVTYSQHRTEAKELASEINSRLVLHLDVTKRQSIFNMMKRVQERCGRIDVLVNNAGINQTGDFDKITEDEWDAVIDVDLKGVFICCQEVLPYISDGGRIINIGSISGEYGGPRTPSYAAAKAGVMALTHCLARFVGQRRITVNCISPGAIESELLDSTMQGKLRKEVMQMILLGRLGAPEEVAAVATFLASDEASYITGQVISVNGGAWVRW